MAEDFTSPEWRAAMDELARQRRDTPRKVPTSPSFVDRMTSSTVDPAEARRDGAAADGAEDPIKAGDGEA